MGGRVGERGRLDTERWSSMTFEAGLNRYFCA